MKSSDSSAEEASFLERNAKRLNQIPFVPVGEEIDNVNHPPHYNKSDARCACGKPIECIEVTRHLNFNIGNAMKYLWRVDLKGAEIEDLKKAAWYINDEIAKRETQS